MAAKRLESSGRIALGESGHLDDILGGSQRLKEMQKEHKTLQEEMRKLRSEMIVVRKENEDATKRAAQVQLKLTERVREKGELENKYHKLRSLLSDQDVKLFFAKQQSERLRQKAEKENHVSRQEESKAFKAKLQELEDILVRSEHEKAELDHQRVEEVEHTQQEYQAITASLRQQLIVLDGDKAHVTAERDAAVAKLSLLELQLQEMAAAADEAGRLHTEESGALTARIDDLTQALSSAETAVEELGLARENDRVDLLAQVAALQASEENLKSIVSKQEEDLAALESNLATAQAAAEAGQQSTVMMNELEQALSARYKAEDHSRLISMEMDELQHELERLQAFSGALETQLNERTASTAATRAEMSLLEEKLKSLEAELAGAVAARDAQAQQADELKARVAAAESMVAHTEEKMKAELARAAAHESDAIAALQAQHDAALAARQAATQAEVGAAERALHAQLAELASRLEETIQHSDRIERGLKEKQARIAELESKLTAASTKADEADALRARLDECMTQLCGVQATVQSAMKDMETAFAAELAGGEAALAAAKQSAAQQAANHAAQLQEVNAQLAALESERARLAAANEEHEVAQENMRTEFAKAQAALQTASEELTRHATALVETQAQLAARTERARVAEEKQASMEAALDETRRALEEAQTSATVSVTAAAQIAERDAELVTLNTKLLQAEARAEQTAKAAAAKEEEMGRELSQTARQCLDEMSRADAFQRERDMLQSEVTRLDRLGNITRQENIDLIREVETMQQKMAQVPLDVTAKLQAALAERDGLRSEIDELRRKETELNELTAQLAGHQNPKQRIHYLELLKRENQQLKKRIADLTGHPA
eukprot:m.24791 g.24791  ORF g.24791 m.24791 type:complete len:849 (-) comp8766_c0_seq1:85-2631(-)